MGFKLNAPNPGKKNPNRKYADSIYLAARNNAIYNSLPSYNATRTQQLRDAKTTRDQKLKELNQAEPQELDTTRGDFAGRGTLFSGGKGSYQEADQNVRTRFADMRTGARNEFNQANENSMLQLANSQRALQSSINMDWAQARARWADRQTDV